MARPRPPDQLVVLGRLAAPFGVRGWLRVQPYTAAPEGLGRYRSWWLGRGAVESWRRVQVLECEPHGRVLLARLEGVADRDAAARLRGLEVAVPRAELPATRRGEYYWSDLLGLRVVNLQGEELGVVAGLLETGAHAVLRVQGERERLIPFVGAVVRGVRLKAGVITVDWGRDY